MSLEASLQAESLKVLNSIDKNRGRSLSPGSGARGRSLNVVNSMSRSVSRTKPEEYKWSITTHDPSERLKSDARLKEDTEDEDDEDDEDYDDKYEPSEEEIISGDELDAAYTKRDEQEGVTELPNYAAVLSRKETTQLPTGNDRLSKEARKAVLFDELDAAHRAMINAKETRSEVPPESKKQFDEIAGELGYAKTNTVSYQEADERKSKLQSYATYKKKLISADSNNEYTNSVEEKLDRELAKKLNSKVVKSEIESDPVHQRAVRTLVRGDFFELLKKTKEQPKTFLLCMDFSPESIYALEWAVGTILVDGSVLYVVNVLEDTEYASANINGDQSRLKTIATASSSLVSFTPRSTDREGIRKESVDYMTNAVLDKLGLTKLQVHVVIESIHHPIPRHLILEIIDHLSPNLVVVGSKGRSSLKGVLLGSLSNYIVTKSSVPVMVVRSKLKRMSRKKKQFSNNLSPLHINQARVD